MKIDETHIPGGDIGFERLGQLLRFSEFYLARKYGYRLTWQEDNAMQGCGYQRSS